MQDMCLALPWPALGLALISAAVRSEKGLPLSITVSNGTVRGGIKCVAHRHCTIRRACTVKLPYGITR